MESRMNGALPLVSIVCPAFQEEQVLPIFHERLQLALKALEHRFRFEIIYVDDGSSDRTLDVLRQIAKLDPTVSYLSLSRNFGHQAALTAGLEHARGDAVISMDADLQHPPAVLEELLNHWQDGYDVVITIRAEDARLPWLKRITSSAFYWLMQQISETEIRMSASDFRLLSRKALQALLQLKEQHRFVRGMVQWLGFRVKEVPFQPDERQAGVSKYTLQRMLRLAGDGLFSFSRAPLRLPLYLSGVFFGLGALHALLAGLSWLQSSGTTAWHYLFLVIHLGLGCVLGSLGVLGEYIGRVHDQVKERPIYLLKECEMRPIAAASPSERREAA
ncbi:MAG: glycosyltransferase family 2 protein [Planctomycetes bacterium]|nr:glycosyltransferase family 2 protein [Planctomycetota bacterium]